MAINNNTPTSFSFPSGIHIITFTVEASSSRGRDKDKSVFFQLLHPECVCLSRGSLSKSNCRDKHRHAAELLCYVSLWDCPGAEHILNKSTPAPAEIHILQINIDSVQEPVTIQWE